MSMSALLTAVRNQLRDDLKIPETDCDIQPNGQPPPTCGQIYYAVHALSHDPETTNPDQWIGEVYNIGITITRRAAAVPTDRRPTETLYKATTGLEARARAVVKNLHMKYDVITDANALISGTDKIQEPLRWQGTDAEPEEVDGTWYHGRPDERAGLTLTVRLGGAMRYQTLANLE